MLNIFYKTEIMVFSSRDTKLYFNFDFEGASLRDVELHKHLGVIFSNDCKWTKLPQTIRAASICTFSKRFELNWPQLNQTSDAYSKIGLIKVK
jgi:hypothetical protein